MTESYSTHNADTDNKTQLDILNWGIEPTKIYHVYVITCRKDGNKRYVGATTGSVEVRWEEHRYGQTSKALWEALKKHGEESFRVEEAVCVKRLVDLKWAEKELIKQWDTVVPRGYNLNRGGGAVRERGTMCTKCKERPRGRGGKERWCSECRKEYDRVYEKTRNWRDAAKRNASAYLRMYIKRGRVAIGPCIKCGVISTRNRPVWRDYSRPLEVIWSCAKHEEVVKLTMIRDREMEW